MLPYKIMIKTCLKYCDGLDKPLSKYFCLGNMALISRFLFYFFSPSGHLNEATSIPKVIL